MTCAHRSNQRIETKILPLIERLQIAAFKLDADRKIVAALSPLPARCTGVPCPLIGSNKLNDLAITPDQKMRRHAQRRDGLEIRVRQRIELIEEKFFDRIAAELLGRQADGMNND